ncbi:MAG TPA: hypothetical protein PKO06_18090 [Candidatus Ozemobacteraceae bacterium]|nr:hypothetical protein [Candidatus Ozemobacteraceae bacterium]
MKRRTKSNKQVREPQLKIMDYACPTDDEVVTFIGGPVEVMHVRDGEHDHLILYHRDGFRSGAPLNKFASWVANQSIYGNAILLVDDGQWTDFILYAQQTRSEKRGCFHVKTFHQFRRTENSQGSTAEGEKLSATDRKEP